MSAGRCASVTSVVKLNAGSDRDERYRLLMKATAMKRVYDLLESASEHRFPLKWLPVAGMEFDWSLRFTAVRS